MQDLNGKQEKLKLLSEVEYCKLAGMTQAQYAKHRNVSRQMVYKYIHDNKYIDLMPNGKINVEAADEMLENKLDPTFTGNVEEQRDAKANKINRNSLHEMKRIQLSYKIKREKLEFEKSLGNVIYKKQTANAYSNKVSAVINRLQKIAKRIAPAIAKESDMYKCEKMINTEIKDAVEEFH